MTITVSVLGGTAFAGTVDVHLNSLVTSRDFKYWLGSTQRANPAGVFSWTRTGGDHPSQPTGDFHSVCIEVDQYINFGGNYTYNMIELEDGPKPGLALGAGPMGDTKADQIRKLWAAHYDEALTSNDKGAAFQVAVWETVYDDDDDLFAGGFRARYTSLASAPTFVQLAQQWLNGVSGLTAMANLGAMSSCRQQDQIVMVPLPAAAWAGMGLLGGIAAIRRARRKARTA